MTSNVFVEQLIDDIKEYIEETDLSQYVRNGRIDMDRLSDGVEMVVTGNADGSYTFNRAEALDNIIDFIKNGDPEDLKVYAQWFVDTQTPVPFDEPEEMDVYARLCFFDEAFADVVSSDWFDKTVAESL